MEEKKREAAKRMTMFLNFMFASMNSCGCGFGFSYNGEIVIIDDETKFSKRFTQNEFNDRYAKYVSALGNSNNNKGM